jgi:hypothetical protein
MDMENLRDRVRAEVIAALQALENSAAVSPPSNTPNAATAPTQPPIPVSETAILFTGSQPPSADFMKELSNLAAAGRSFALLLSHTYAQFHDPAATLKLLPAGTRLISPENEVDFAALCAHFTAVIAPHFSTNTTAKIALGIADSAPTRLVASCLAADKPIFVGTDIAALSRDLADQLAAAPPPVLRTAEDHLRKLQQIGIQFIDTASLARIVQAHFTPVVNETPARLARTRPTQKREFVTAEDVWRVASHGGKVLNHARDAIITDQARDQAAMKGIELHPD